MMAHVVCITHIDAPVTAGLKLSSSKALLAWTDLEVVDRRPMINYEKESPRRTLTIESADRVGAMLLAENQRCANCFYGTDCLEEVYEFQELPGMPDPVKILKAIDCYQAAAGWYNPKWHRSEAKEFCGALQALCIRQLPGYRLAPWEISRRNVFLRPEDTSESGA